ncbi:protein rhomboid isoform X1 [Halyomorpha halys]|uniref:protein rhomboid isoform X1 n=1 Tax=Halyomorpha halys TaxID=286706 RepID=UPI0006D4EDEC|nr:protein rhomboid-like isoform X1 [Halyomorpha halys]
MLWFRWLTKMEPSGSGSLGSSGDLKNNLLHDKWRTLFDKFDPEGFGEIPWEDLSVALDSPEFAEEVPPAKREALAQRAAHHTTSAITFQDFVNIMSGKRRRSFKCAVHQLDREVSSEHDFHLVLRQPPLFTRMVQIIADEFLTHERDRKYYADHYTCCPPPLFILFITLLELGFFTYYTVATGEMNPAGPVPIDSVFIYRPDKREEIWRFFFYMVLHAGWLHLLFNLLVQVLVGLPLEMVHGSLRIGTVYMAGVLAGSLGTSVFDMDVYLVGASGGVYALLAAHLANVLLNYNNMEFGIVRLVGIFVVASADVGFAIYDRYASENAGPPVSYVAHLTGALAGLTIGLLVLKNFEQKLHEQLIWWVALGVYAACTIFAVLFNLFTPSFPP